MHEDPQSKVDNLDKRFVWVDTPDGRREAHHRRELDGAGTKIQMMNRLKKSALWPKLIEQQQEINELLRESNPNRQDRDLEASLPQLMREAWCPCFRTAKIK